MNSNQPDTTARTSRAWPLRRLLLAAYVGLVGAALLAVSLGLRVLVDRYLDQAMERAARETTAESWSRLGLPVTEFWRVPEHGGVVVTERLSARQLEELVRDLARPERIVRWKGAGSSVTVQAGGRPETRALASSGRQVASTSPDLYWWGLTVTTPRGPLGVLEMGLDRRSDRDLLEALGRYLFFCSLGVLLLAVVICARLSVSWLKPLEELDRTFEALADGDLSARPPNIEAAVVPAEWRTLRQSATRMATRLERSFISQRRFISDASHELRTPLTAVAAMAELLESDDLNEQGRSKAQTTIFEESRRMGRLVEDLLALSRADEGRPIPNGESQLCEVLSSLSQEFSESHPARRLHIECPPEARLEIAPTLLRTILRNLLENALRYSDDLVCCRVVESADRIEVVVEDTGCGIPEEELDKIFDRFYRADHSRSRATGGSGLGLAIVKMLADETGAQVSLSSRLGEGTQVKVLWRRNA